MKRWSGLWLLTKWRRRRAAHKKGGEQRETALDVEIEMPECNQRRWKGKKEISSSRGKSPGR